MRKTFPEDYLQMACATYLDARNFLWCHVANERKATVSQGKRLKKKGVKPGVPDILIFNTTKTNHHGVAIELKIKGNTTTESQKRWLKQLHQKNWITAVCYSLDEVMDLIKIHYK